MLTALAVGVSLLLVSLDPAASLRALAFSASFRQTGVTLLASTAIAFLITHTGERYLAPLRSRTLTFFGLISYAMYMTHLYVMMLYDQLRGALRAGDTAAYTIRFICILGGTIAVCLLSRYLVELPAISLRRFVLDRPAPPHPEAPPLPLDNI
jgi:peptidoglycan/LPS O-acetylase OafA/YrhL